ncbi:MAG: hypothetical protein AAF907_08535, partial [Planctomycetota bacterium]
YHWDADGGSWTASRAGSDGASPSADSLGGGHSHAGAMVYQGDNWPEEYRGDLFMCNTHGKRINREALVPHGSGYKITHKPDFAFANSPWFKGVDLASGPDGGVFVLDWTDLGECHDHDGVHRTSGRIYKLTYGKPERAGETFDLAKRSPKELMAIAVSHPDVWHRRHASRLLIQPNGEAGPRFNAAQRQMNQEGFEPLSDVSPDLFALRSVRLAVAASGVDLDAIEMEGGTEPGLARSMLVLMSTENPFRLAAQVPLSEELRAVFPGLNDAMIDLIVERYAPPPEAEEEMRAKPAWQPLMNAARSQSPRQRLAALSAIQRHPPIAGLAVGREIAVDPIDAADDHNLPLMAWYAAEPGVAADPKAGGRFAVESQIPLLREYATRRLASELPSEPHAAAVSAILAVGANRRGADFQKEALRGLLAALEGRRKVTPPAAWADVQPVFAQSDDAQVRALAQKLSVIFGDGAALEELRAVVADTSRSDAARAAAIESLAEARDEAAVPLLLEILKKRRGENRNLNAVAGRALGSFDDDAIPDVLLKALPRGRLEERGALLATLVSRRSYARKLAEALPDLGAEYLTAEHVRALRALNDAPIDAVLDEVWGTNRATPAEKLAEIKRWKTKLAGAENADLGAGRTVFNSSCGRCHKLYGEGGELGPNLTGSDRQNLDYLLGNIFDPSAVV